MLPVFLYFSSKIDVQCGHLVALMEISLIQNGQTFVVGSAGASGFFPIVIILLMAFKRQNKINAVMIKFNTVETNAEPNPATSLQL